MNVGNELILAYYSHVDVTLTFDNMQTIKTKYMQCLTKTN